MATLTSLDQFITDYVAAVSEEIPTAWVLVAATTTLEDMDNHTATIHIEKSPGQSVFTTDGLLYNALQRNMW